MYIPEIISCSAISHCETFAKRPLLPNFYADSNINPQNTQCNRACPVGPEDRTGRLKFSSSPDQGPGSST
jgi:hypothetical protein